MNRNDSANILAGIFQNKDSQANAPTNLHLITGEVKEKSENGKALVEMDGMVFSGSNEQYVEMDAIGGLEEGDTAAILLSGESGKAMVPFVLGSVGTVDRVRDTAENAMTVGNENISPFLSHDLTDRGNNASGAYWFSGTACRLALDSATQLEDGWARFRGNAYQMALRVNQSQINVTAGATYTLLVELRNIDTAPNGDNLLMLNSNQTCQLYGDGETHDYEEGEYRIAATGSSNTTQSMQIWLCNNNAATYDFEMRVSLYEGEYHGPYKSVVADKESLSATTKLAQSALDVANATGQHFWDDSNGAHVTEATREDFEQNQSGPNSLINSLGMLIRNGLNNLMAVLTTGIAMYDGMGNAAANIIASFSPTVVELAKQISDTEITTGQVSMFGGKAYILGTIDPPNKTQAIRVSSYDSDGSDQLYAETRSLSGFGTGREANAEQTLNAQIYDGTNTVSSSVGAIVYRDAIGTVGQYAYARAKQLWLSDTNQINEYIDMPQAIVALEQPCFTATGAATSTTASAAGWQLTYFNTIKNQDLNRRWQNYITFSNGRITAARPCLLEISGAMNWTDTIAGIRGFGLFKNAAVGSGADYERSVFQHFLATNTSRKTVVFPPQVIWLDAGGYINIGRYQQANAVYQDGTNYSWVTVRIVNATS